MISGFWSSPVYSWLRPWFQWNTETTKTSYFFGRALQRIPKTEIGESIFQCFIFIEKFLVDIETSTDPQSNRWTYVFNLIEIIEMNASLYFHMWFIESSSIISWKIFYALSAQFIENIHTSSTPVAKFQEHCIWPYRFYGRK